ncbi:MAG: hypothetical protein JG766_1439 [Desulfacinum sp.]|nr:hypothetical protein [Desulfacinum sp.]
MWREIADGSSTRLLLGGAGVSLRPTIRSVAYREKGESMGRYLDLVVREAGPDASGPSLEVRVSAEGMEDGAMLAVCSSLEELSRLVDSLKHEADRLVEKAAAALRELETQAKGEEDVTPEEVWRRMEAAPSDEEMFRYFNSLSEERRREAAEYILTHVSMFKGRGPVFAEHYNIVEHTLDEEKML